MKDTFALGLGVAMVVLLIGGVIWYELAVWDECLEKNSFMYCMRMMAR